MKEKTKLRVISYNIHKGFSAGNKRFVLSKIREAIRSVKADLVFLQEVLGQHQLHSRTIKEWPDQPQFEYIADSIWPHFAYGKNSVYTMGHHGNAILSKYPFSFWENIDISTNRVEQRGLLHGIIEIPHRKKPVHAMCVHLGLLESERKVQLNKLCDRIASHAPADEPLIVAGDFNDWRGTMTAILKKKLDVREAFEEIHGRHARTFPIWLPTLRLDRIYLRHAEIQSAECLTSGEWAYLSDHAGLFSEVSV